MKLEISNLADTDLIDVGVAVASQTCDCRGSGSATKFVSRPNCLIPFIF